MWIRRPVQGASLEEPVAPAARKGEGIAVVHGGRWSEVGGVECEVGKEEEWEIHLTYETHRQTRGAYYGT